MNHEVVPQMPLFISLGYNCEVSQILKYAFGGIDSHVWSWAYADSIQGLVSSILNSTEILKGPTTYAFDNRGIKFTNVGLSFHARGIVNLSDPGDEYQKELIERVNHLIAKYSNLDEDKGKIIFIAKVKATGESTYKYIKSLRNALNERFPNSTLAVVLSKEIHGSICNDIKNVDLYYVAHYAHPSFTSQDCCFLEWFNILTNYATLSKTVFGNNVKSTCTPFIKTNNSFDKINRVETELAKLSQEDFKDDPCLFAASIRSAFKNHNISTSFIINTLANLKTNESKQHL